MRRGVSAIKERNPRKGTETRKGTYRLPTGTRIKERNPRKGTETTGNNALINVRGY